MLLELLLQRPLDLFEEVLALLAALVDGCLHLLEAHGVDIAKGQVLELAAHLAHAQAVRQRSVDVQRLLCDGLLPLHAKVLQGAHVVQAVGQLDEHDAHIAHHRQQHLAHVFGLAVFAVRELDLVDLGDAFDDVRHLLAEESGDVVRRHGVSSTASCRRPAAMAVESSFISASTCATSRGCSTYGSPEARTCP